MPDLDERELKRADTLVLYLITKSPSCSYMVLRRTDANACGRRRVTSLWGFLLRSEHELACTKRGQIKVPAASSLPDPPRAQPARKHDSDVDSTWSSHNGAQGLSPSCWLLPLGRRKHRTWVRASAKDGSFLQSKQLDGPTRIGHREPD